MESQFTIEEIIKNECSPEIFAKNHRAGRKLGKDEQTQKRSERMKKIQK